jgi:hypothetical protein
VLSEEFKNTNIVPRNIIDRYWLVSSAIGGFGLYITLMMDLLNIKHSTPIIPPISAESENAIPVNLFTDFIFPSPKLLDTIATVPADIRDAITNTVEDAEPERDAAAAEAALGSTEAKDRFAELGDLLFAIVNVARYLNIDPEEALRATTTKFMRRFKHIEQQAAAAGRSLADMTLEEMDRFWDEAKALEKQ